MLRWLALAWLCAAAAAVDTGGCVDEANQCARSFTGQGVCTDFAGYTGTKNVTMFGHPCERWDALGGNPYPDGSSAFLLTKVASLSDLGNRCVSWAHFGGGPWCRVTTIGGNDWQYCFPPCGEAECVDEAAQCARRASRGVCDNYLAYTGTKDTAADGTPCHPWSDSSNVDRGFDTFNVSKVAEGALCRNPDRDTKGPWCYTATNNGGPKPCFPDCPDPVDPCIDLHPNRTIDQGNGNAIATTPGRSLAQCAVDCVAHSACGTFVWTEDQNCVLQATPPPFEESLSAENATSTVAGINRCAQTEVLEDGSTCFVHYPLTDAYMPITHFFDATPDISTCASECSLVGETCTGATYKEVGEDCWLLNVTKAQVLEAAVTETQLSLLLRCPGPPTTSTTAALTTTERPCVQLYPNQTVDTSGDHILETLSGVSLEGCSAACRARSACTAFVWQADESKCLLKATPPPYDGTLASSDRLAGIDTCAEVSKVHHSAVCFIRYPETEFVGPNIGSTAVGEASCAELCADSPICNGLLFEQDPEYCWFYGQAKKDIIKGSETASNHTLYVRCEEPRNNCSSFYSGKSFGDDDGDLLETQAGLSSAEECAEACVRRSACSVFEWLHTSSECRLLATPDLDASALEVAVGTNITSGIDTCAQVTEVDVSGGCFVRYPDTHFQGTPVVDDFSVNDETACVEACQANTSCVGVAYETDRKYCWLMPQDREMLLLGSFTQLLRVLLVRCPRPTTTTAELTTTEKPCVQLFSNNTIDTGGGRLLRTVAGQTVAQCAAECRATPACTTFVLDKNNECSLKGTRQPFNDKLNDKAGNWAGMDTCAQVSEVTAGGVCFVRYPDTRFGGGHIGMVVVGETECLGYCASSELCNGVTRNANGTCRFLGLRTSQLLRGSGTALNQTLLTRCSETDQIRVNPCVHHYPNTSVVGGDLLKNMTELGSLGDCGEACVRLASCSVFQWDDGTKECLLVSTPQPYEGALEPWTLADRTAGINTCAGISEVNLDGACFVRYADTDYPLANVRVQDPQNETSCGLLCADDAQCNGAVFQKLTETCWRPPRPLPGADDYNDADNDDNGSHHDHNIYNRCAADEHTADDHVAVHPAMLDRTPGHEAQGPGVPKRHSSGQFGDLRGALPGQRVVSRGQLQKQQQPVLPEEGLRMRAAGGRGRRDGGGPGGLSRQGLADPETTTAADHVNDITTSKGNAALTTSAHEEKLTTEAPTTSSAPKTSTTESTTKTTTEAPPQKTTSIGVPEATTSVYTAEDWCLSLPGHWSATTLSCFQLTASAQPMAQGAALCAGRTGLPEGYRGRLAHLSDQASMDVAFQAAGNSMPFVGIRRSVTGTPCPCAQLYVVDGPSRAEPAGPLPWHPAGATVSGCFCDHPAQDCFRLRPENRFIDAIVGWPCESAQRGLCEFTPDGLPTLAPSTVNTTSASVPTTTTTPLDVEQVITRGSTVATTAGKGELTTQPATLEPTTSNIQPTNIEGKQSSPTDWSDSNMAKVESTSVTQSATLKPISASRRRPTSSHGEQSSAADGSDEAIVSRRSTPVSADQFTAATTVADRSTKTPVGMLASTAVVSDVSSAASDESSGATSSDLIGASDGSQTSETLDGVSAGQTLETTEEYDGTDADLSTRKMDSENGLTDETVVDGVSAGVTQNAGVPRSDTQVPLGSTRGRGLAESSKTTAALMDGPNQGTEANDATSVASWNMELDGETSADGNAATQQPDNGSETGETATPRAGFGQGTDDDHSVPATVDSTKMDSDGKTMPDGNVATQESDSNDDSVTNQNGVTNNPAASTDESQGANNDEDGQGDPSDENQDGQGDGTGDGGSDGGQDGQGNEDAADDQGADSGQNGQSGSGDGQDEQGNQDEQNDQGGQGGQSDQGGSDASAQSAQEGQDDQNGQAGQNGQNDPKNPTGEGGQVGAEDSYAAGVVARPTTTTLSPEVYKQREEAATDTITRELNKRIDRALSASLSAVSLGTGPMGVPLDGPNNASVEWSSGAAAVGAVLKDSLPYVVAELTDEELARVGYTKEETIIRCEYDGVPCKLEEFAESFDRRHGNCFTWEEDHLVTDPNGKRGLSMQLKVHQADYMSMVESVGAKIVIHKRGTAAVPYAESSTLSTGFETSFGISLGGTRHLGRPYPHCVKHRNETSWSFRGSYSKTGCEQICTQEATLDECGCLDPLKVALRHKNASNCLLKDQARLSKFLGSVEAEENAYCDQCGPPCEDDFYSTTQTRVRWPTLNEPRCAILATAEETAACLRRLGSETVGLKVHVTRLPRVIYHEVPVTTVVDGVSSFAGITGILLGASALTVAEFIQALFEVARAACKK